VQNIEARPETDFKDLPLKPTAHAATYRRELTAVHDRIDDAGQNALGKPGPGASASRQYR
jgi:hypothetical protein